MKQLWLDDVRDPWMFGWGGSIWAKTADEAIEVLKTGQVEYASLDHDLTWEQTIAGWGPYGEISDTGAKSGYDVILWLEHNQQYWPSKGIKVHSQNPAGKKRMEQVIERVEWRRNHEHRKSSEH